MHVHHPLQSFSMLHSHCISFFAVFFNVTLSSYQFLCSLFQCYTHIVSVLDISLMLLELLYKLGCILHQKLSIPFIRIRKFPILIQRTNDDIISSSFNFSDQYQNWGKFCSHFCCHSDSGFLTSSSRKYCS